MKQICPILVRRVATWSHLASTFNAKPSLKTDFRFRKQNAGLFLSPVLRSADGFYVYKEEAIRKSEELVEEAISSQRKRKMVEIFDELSNTLCKVADLAEFIRLAHPDKTFVNAAEDASVTISGLVEKLNTHRSLYDALRKVQESGDVSPVSEMDRHVGDLFQFDFEQSGIHLDEDNRQRVVKILEHIIYLSQMFSEGTLQHRSVKKEYVSPTIRHFFNIDGDRVTVTGLYSEHNNELVREAAYRIYLHPDSQQEQLLTGLVNARHNLAQLCGFPTFAHRALRGSLAGGPQFVAEFLDLLRDEILHHVDNEMVQMSKIKRKVQSNSKPLMAWDPPYIAAVVKSQCLLTDEVTPYFSLGACMEGLNSLVNSLYGITLQVEDTEAGEVWHPQVYKLVVKDKCENVLGFIYCDFFDRRGKHYQDCHFTIRGSKLLSDGTYQIPVVVLNLNLPSSSFTQPILLTPSLLDNLFHEMGHALHSVLGRTRYQHVAGTRCSIDMSEVPSTLMEYFARNVQVLQGFARHYKTGEPIPEELALRLIASRQVFPAMEMQQQIFYSALDQTIHSGPLADHSLTHVLKTVHQKYYSLPYIENTAWQLRFSHLVGYGAKYYSYLMARAVSALIWQELFQKQPFSQEMGQRFLSEVLCHGGEKPARDMVSGLLGRELTPSMLVSSLKEEITAINTLQENI